MFDIAQLLNVKLRSNPAWRALAEKLEDLINSTVGAATDEAMNAIGNPYRYLRGDSVDPRTFSDISPVAGGSSIEQMMTRRERSANVSVLLPTDDNGGSSIYMEMDGDVYVATTNRFHTRDILINESKLLGFDFFSDDLTDADYARVMLFISQYWPTSGSRDTFANFLGFIRNIRIELVQLWTTEDGSDDYNVLDRYRETMIPVWDGGVYYPSFLYDMQFDAFQETDINELRRLFFAMAPIHLVLHRMIETARATATGYASAAPLVAVHESMEWLQREPKECEAIKYAFTANNINIPVQLVSANLKPNNISVAAMGSTGVWMLEKDPAIANPSNPVQYMLDHALYIAPSTNPQHKFVFPPNGVFDSGLWFMGTTAGTGCLIEIT